MRPPDKEIHLLKEMYKAMLYESRLRFLMLQY